MTVQLRAASDLPASSATFQRPKLLRITGAMVAGVAVATAIEVVLLVFDTPWQSIMLLAAAGLFLWQLAGAMLAVPVWDLLYRCGYRRWWQAVVFGGGLGLFVVLISIRDLSVLALRFDGTIAIGSAVVALIIWWLAYRPRT